MLRRPLASGLLLIAAATTLSACSSSPTRRASDVSHSPGNAAGSGSGASQDAPVRLPPSTAASTARSKAPVKGAPAGLECGVVPTSTGPLAKSARLSFQAPSSASPGETVSVTATVSSPAPLPRVLTTPATSAVLVVHDGHVVGGATGGAAAEIPLDLSSGTPLPAQALPKSVRLNRCGPNSADLTAGNYALVAVLGYRVDALNSAPNDGTPTVAQAFVLVSPPSPITIG